MLLLEVNLELIDFAIQMAGECLGNNNIKTINDSLAALLNIYLEIKLF